MVLLKTLKCDSCQTTDAPRYYVVTARPIEAKSSQQVSMIGNVGSGATFDLCMGCVLKRFKGLPREQGDLLPEEPAELKPEPICRCGATEYMEGTMAQYCENGHPIDPEHREPDPNGQHSANLPPRVRDYAGVGAETFLQWVRRKLPL